MNVDINIYRFCIKQSYIYNRNDINLWSIIRLITTNDENEYRGNAVRVRR